MYDDSEEWLFDNLIMLSMQIIMLSSHACVVIVNVNSIVSLNRRTSVRQR
jgi:hypothetical protein